MPDCIVITDTSCLVLFDKLQVLDMLHEFHPNVATTPEVASEFKKPLPVWLMIIPVKDTRLTNSFRHVVDLGEASAIALAHEIPDPYLF